MKLNRQIFKTELGGEVASLEFSEIAGKANAAVIGRLGETAVLVTVVMSEKDKEGDFFPLTVDYEERFYAAGKIIGSRFIRREGRPSDEATLSARLVDRTIRPLFDHRLRREVQVTITILAYDEKNDPDPIALLATSAALAVSDIPWNGPVAGLRTDKRSEKGGFLAFFAGPRDRINMIEFEGDEIKEKELAEIFETSKKEINKLIDFQESLIKKIGKPKAPIALRDPDPRVRNLVREFIKKDLERAIKEKTLNDLKLALMEHLTASQEPAETLKMADEVFENEIDEYVHQEILEREKRPDGRGLDEVRDLYAEVGLFRRTHGSGLFIRGETQVLAVTTLASPAAEQLIETMETTGKKRFMLHYNFPNFSTGETGRSRGPGRREIGHGTLALRALNAVIPPKEIFPYTIRVVAETLSSNGSSSMASVCAATLSLMDAGVPLRKPVAGIAMGLMLGEKNEYKILTDIQGPEDHHGDMDCKIAGTEDGVTAIQMDVKVRGITKEIFEKTLEGAKKARLHILEAMKKAIAEPRAQVSPFAPTIVTLQIDPLKIGEVIGPGGKVINSIIAKAGGNVAIDIEEDGKVYVSSTDPKAVEQALNEVKQIVREFKVGDIIEGEVIKILDFGAIVDLGGGRDGMIHVSELKNGYVKKVEDVLKLGSFVRAKVIRAEDGRISLSLKALNGQ